MSTALSLRLLHCYSKPGRLKRKQVSLKQLYIYIYVYVCTHTCIYMNIFPFVWREASHHVCICLQEPLDMVLYLCGLSVSACRERAIVSAESYSYMNFSVEWPCDHCFDKLLSPSIVSLYRVCKCSGAADRSEVHHWPGCHYSPMDRTL